MSENTSRSHASDVVVNDAILADRFYVVRIELCDRGTVTCTMSGSELAKTLRRYEAWQDPDDRRTRGLPASVSIRQGESFGVEMTKVIAYAKISTIDYGRIRD